MLTKNDHINICPLVSVIMPAYNSENTIEPSIISVINQTYKYWELIVVDDCSTDNTLEIASKFADKDGRIKIIHLPDNLQAAGARNKGIMQSSGKYISFLDSDDLWEPNKIEFQINFMEKNNIAFSYGNYYVKKKNGDIIKFKAPEVATYKLILSNCYIGCLTAMYNSDLLGKILMPIEAKKREDHATWLAILKKVNGYNCNEFIATYNLVANSVSSNKIKMIKYQWRLYRRVEHLNFLSSALALVKIIINRFTKY